VKGANPSKEWEETWSDYIAVAIPDCY
jgi:hypothetical protein